MSCSFDAGFERRSSRFTLIELAAASYVAPFDLFGALHQCFVQQSLVFAVIELFVSDLFAFFGAAFERKVVLGHLIEFRGPALLSKSFRSVLGLEHNLQSVEPCLYHRWTMI